MFTRHSDLFYINAVRILIIRAHIKPGYCSLMRLTYTDIKLGVKLHYRCTNPTFFQLTISNYRFRINAILIFVSFKTC